MRDARTCHTARLLATAPSQDLSSSQREQLEEHLAECTDCASAQKRYDVLRTYIRSAADEEPISDFAPRWSQVRSAISQKRRQRAFSIEYNKNLLDIGIAVIVVIVLFLPILLCFLVSSISSHRIESSNVSQLPSNQSNNNRSNNNRSNSPPQSPSNLPNNNWFNNNQSNPFPFDLNGSYTGIMYDAYSYIRSDISVTVQFNGSDIQGTLTLPNVGTSSISGHFTSSSERVEFITQIGGDRIRFSGWPEGEQTLRGTYYGGYAWAYGHWTVKKVREDTSPSNMARSTVQRYYDAINNKDYRTAYTIWQGNDTSNREPYHQFVAGYGNTLHDDITFESITPQDDHTVHVTITIHAKQRNGSETFRASYIVAKIGEDWKFAEGSLEKIG